MGVVAGQLVQYIAEEEVGPSVGVRLFLAEILMGEDGTAPMAALDEAEAPQVTTGEHGEFVFLDVPPGMYALIIKTPISAMLAHDVVDEEDVVVEVSAGEAVDMGSVRVELPF